jgi:predicted acylesterase/phospholipase RssA
MQNVDITPFKNKKTALVLSGGVVKAAAWHTGVALALEEMGFYFKDNYLPIEKTPQISTYVGSSAGSIVNSYFASGFTPAEVAKAFLDKSDRLTAMTYKDMMSLRRPIKGKNFSSDFDPFEGFPFFLKKLISPITNISGFFSTQGLHDYMQKHVLTSNRFEDYAADLFVVATQLDNSRKVIFSKYNYPNPYHDDTANYYTGIGIAESVAASTAVPPFYSPYPVKNPHNDQTDYYIDGEIRETLSTHIALDNKCDLVISSWTHTPYHYDEAIGSLVHYGLPAIAMQAIYLLIQKKIVASRARRHSAQDIIQTVSDYMKTNKMNEKHRKDIISILERKLHFDKNVKLIDICPGHDNHDIFFRNFFSLNQEMLSKVVNMGYKRCFEVFQEL